MEMLEWPCLESVVAQIYQKETSCKQFIWIRIIHKYESIQMQLKARTEEKGENKRKSHLNSKRTCMHRCE